VRKRTASPGPGSLGSGALTAASTLVVTGASVLAGVIIAREFGLTDETDGFFAAYGVFVVVVIAAQAIRIAVLPSLARAQQERRLAADLAGYAVALAVIAAPAALLAELAAEPIASLLTGGGSTTAQDAADETLRWIVPAGIAHLFAGLAASGLAALDDYVTAAIGYAVGGVLGIALILLRVEEDGIIAVAWGMTLNGAVALGVPLAALALRAQRSRMPAGAMRPSGPPIRARLGWFATAAALPLAMQLLYVVCLPFAAREGEGAPTSFTYAYIGAAALVTITASSLGLVTSVPLTRTGVDASSSTRHVVSSSWLALVVVGAAAGAFALAGAQIVEAVLGGSYGGDVGVEVTRVVISLSPWIAISVSVGIAFPLVFVPGKTRVLPWVGAVALALQVPLAWAAQELAGLVGLGLSLAVSTSLVLAGLLHSLGVLRDAARGLVIAIAVVTAVAIAAYLPPALVLGSLAAAAVGLLVYCALVALVRPPGLRAAWRYLRSLS
jgi:putative peptidoglycan lipid II flippase